MPEQTEDHGIGASGGGSSLGPGKGGGGGGTGFDDAPVIRAARVLPPISGGTLLPLRAGGRVLVADPDRDRVQFVALDTKAVDATIALPAGAEPGRAAEDGAGRVHVALRGSGELLTLDSGTNRVLETRRVCAAPRGVAYDPAHDSVLVACLEGVLVELPAAGGDATRVTSLAPDLRDVVVLGDRVLVTLFREASVLILDPERRIERRVTLPEVSGFAPNVAWRAVPTPDGKLAVLHQRSFSGRLNVSGGSSASGGSGGGPSTRISTTPEQGGEGGAGDDELTLTHDGYGAVEPCSAVVVASVSVVDTSGNVTVGPKLDAGVLPVDIALGSDGVFATAFAGSLAPIGVYSTSLLAEPGTCLPSGSLTGETVVAVAFDTTTGGVIAQTREPAGLDVFWSTNSDQHFTIPLDGESVADTGRDLFHADAGGGLACASCHPEGTDDGRVWNFSDVGRRRTQPLDVGLFGSAPFHWDGELANIDALMSSIFTSRMGGPFESPARAAALEEYLYALPRRPALRDATDAAAVRGKALFESREVGCATCHAGRTLSSGESADIGREIALQVPSLVAVGARAPYMHDGCAPTLLDRFDPTCGGDAHGDISNLSAGDIDALVAYLESL